MKTAALSVNHLQYPITLLLITLMVSVKTMELFFRKLKISFLLHPFSIIRQRQYYRLLTSDFVHHDWAHLMINAYFMYMYAGNLESYLNACGKSGSVQFLIIYLTSCLAGTVMVTLGHKNDFGFSSGGASASIIGCLFSYVILQPKRIAFYLPMAGAISNLYFGFISIIVLFIYKTKSRNEIINYEQHFYGAVAGIVITLIMFPQIIR